MKKCFVASFRAAAFVGLVAGLVACEDTAKKDYQRAAAALRDPVANLSGVRDAMDGLAKATDEGQKLNARMAVGVACEQAIPKFRTLKVDTSKLSDDHVKGDLATLSLAVMALDEEMKPCDRMAPGGTKHPGTLACADFCIIKWPAVVEALDHLADEAHTKAIKVSRLSGK